MIDGPILVMTAWLAGVATGISAARLSSWIHHIRQRRMGPPHARRRAEWASVDDDGNFSIGLVRAHNPLTGYQPRSHGRTPVPPPSDP